MQMEMLAKVVIGAIVIEAIIEYFNAAFLKKLNPQYILSIIFGAAFSMVYELDLLAILGLETMVPYVGMILTGILLSRGSNYLSQFIRKLSAMTPNLAWENNLSEGEPPKE